MALQGGDGQPAGAGAHQVDRLAAGDGATGVERLLQRLHIVRQAALAMARVRVAPAQHEHLEAVIQRVLDEALLGRQVEDVVLVDLRRHDQQRAQVLLFAPRLVLDQFQQFIAEHYGTRGGGDIPAELEGRLADLAGHTAVVSQVVHQVTQAVDQAEPAGVEDLLDRQRVEQAVGGR
ncbi:hypothetical protein D9M68_372660 [compost metagenome]